MAYKIVRRKVLMDNGYKMVKLYECFCKWGTQNLCLCYLFDEPKIGVVTKVIKWCPSTPLYNIREVDVRIWDMNDSFIYLEMG